MGTCEPAGACIGAGRFVKECDVGGRPESKLALGSWRGVLSPGMVTPLPKGNLFSEYFREGQPLFFDEIDAASSSGRFTPESFQKLR